MQNDEADPVRPKIVGLIIFFFIWIVCGLVEYYVAQGEYGRWIELLNGATWPSYFEDVNFKENRGFWFFVVLSLRTVLNLGITFTAAYGVYFFTGPGRILMKNLKSALTIQNTMLAAVIIKVLEENEVELSQAAIDQVYKTAAKFSQKGYFPEQVLQAGMSKGRSASGAV